LPKEKSKTQTLNKSDDGIQWKSNPTPTSAELPAIALQDQRAPLPPPLKEKKKKKTEKKKKKKKKKHITNKDDDSPTQATEAAEENKKRKKEQKGLEENIGITPIKIRLRGPLLPSSSSTSIGSNKTETKKILQSVCAPLPLSISVHDSNSKVAERGSRSTRSNNWDNNNDLISFCTVCTHGFFVVVSSVISIVVWLVIMKSTPFAGRWEHVLGDPIENQTKTLVATNFSTCCSWKSNQQLNETNDIGSMESPTVDQLKMLTDMSYCFLVMWINCLVIGLSSNWLFHRVYESPVQLAAK
jgi:hypothetical protein